MCEARLSLFGEVDMQTLVGESSHGGGYEGRALKNILRTEKVSCRWILMNKDSRRVGELGKVYYQFAKYLLIKGKRQTIELSETEEIDEHGRKAPEQSEDSDGDSDGCEAHGNRDCKRGKKGILKNSVRRRKEEREVRQESSKTDQFWTTKRRHILECNDDKWRVLRLDDFAGDASEWGNVRFSKLASEPRSDDGRGTWAINDGRSMRHLDSCRFPGGAMWGVFRGQAAMVKSKVSRL